MRVWLMLLSLSILATSQQHSEGDPIQGKGGVDQKVSASTKKSLSENRQESGQEESGQEESGTEQLLTDKQIEALDESILGDEAESLHPWVKLQIEEENGQDFQAQEQFFFQLESFRETHFIWPNQHAKTRRIKINAFVIDADQDVTFPNNPPEDQYLQVSSLIARVIKQRPLLLEKVYLTKLLSVDFRGEMAISILNKYTQTILVGVELEGEFTLVHERTVGVVDAQFEQPALKMQAIRGEVERSSTPKGMLFKWEWGYQEKEERHQGYMLHLTGVQSLVILITSIVQIYCIKGLLDNDMIV